MLLITLNRRQKELFDIVWNKVNNNILKLYKLNICPLCL